MRLFCPFLMAQPVAVSRFAAGMLTRRFATLRSKFDSKPRSRIRMPRRLSEAAAPSFIVSPDSLRWPQHPFDRDPVAAALISRHARRYR
jgi:hypothetical protein